MTAVEHLQIHTKNNTLQQWNQTKHVLLCAQRKTKSTSLFTSKASECTPSKECRCNWKQYEIFLPWSEDSFASVSLSDSINSLFKLYVCQKYNLTVLPITTKFSSCFPPCLFSNSAFTSICGFALLDFFAGVGTIFCSSETCTTWGERVDFETASSTPEATLASSGNSPFWGVLVWPFSSAIALGKKRKHKECKWQRRHRNIGEKLSFPFSIL